jgi:hypothetical protein
MPKKGDEYQEIVGAVQRALDQGADVRVGAWEQGPDGRRDRDVQVRGTRHGRPFFTLVDCKDWRRPVGIGAIDALESKRRDLAADLAVVFSNSGFTRPAIRKATRVGIDCASALVAGHKRVRPILEREFVAPRLSVDRYSIEVFFPKEFAASFPATTDMQDLTTQGLPVVNWIQGKSAELLRLHPGNFHIVATYAFKQPTEFDLSRVPLLLTGLRLRLWCSKKWYAQRVSVDVSTGLYDHITGKVVIPDQQSYLLGPFSFKDWHEVDAQTVEDEPELAPGEFSLKMTLMNPVRGVPRKAVPDIDALIGEGDTQVIRPEESIGAS